MSEAWEYLSGVVATQWGNGLFQWYFYLGILAVLLTEKRRAVRIVLGWFPLLFLLAAYTPFFGQLVARVVQRKEGAYLSRLFGFIPLFYVVAHGAAGLLARWKDGAKFLGVCGVAAVIVLSGDSVYHQFWMRPAENPEKAPADAVQIVSALREADPAEGLCVAAPQELAVYLRQLDPRLTTPYARYENKIGRALAAQAMDPEQVMAWAGAQAVDVLAVWKNEDTRADFAWGGWTPFAETDGCLLYRVTGVPRVVRELDDRRRVTREAYLDAEGNPVVGKKGYVAIRYDYNEAGDVVRESYFGPDGLPMIHEGRVYASREFIDDGQKKILIRYYDTDGQLVMEKRQKRK